MKELVSLAALVGVVILLLVDARIHGHVSPQEKRRQVEAAIQNDPEVRKIEGLDVQFDSSGRQAIVSGTVTSDRAKWAAIRAALKSRGLLTVGYDFDVVPEVDVNKVQERIFEILRLQNIYFDYNEATIRPESRESVKRIAAVLQEYGTVGVRIEGHTDAIASEQYNQALSEARAEAVKSALVEYGVADGRIQAVGFGETRPIAPNNTPEGRADNRRIEFKILPPAGEGSDKKGTLG